MTDIWYTSMDNISGEMINRYMEEFSPEMQAEILRYRQEDDRKSRALARKMINMYLQIHKPGAKNEFLLGEHKKPYLPDGPFFNISHSGNYVTVAFSDEHVGIDIEQKREIEWTLITSHFHDAEKAYIQESDDHQNRFYRVWSRKEAYLKANGVGILKGLKSVNALEDIIVDEKGGWYLHDIEIDAAYSSALCTPSPSNKKNVQYKNINSILLTID